MTYPRLPLSTKIFNFTEYIPRTWWETIRSVFKFNYWFKLSLNPRASSTPLLQEWKRETERSIWGSGSARLHFQHCLSSKYCVCAQVFMKSNNNSSAVHKTANHQQLAVPIRIQQNTPPLHSAALFFSERKEPSQTEKSHILPPTICTHAHTPYFSNYETLVYEFHWARLHAFISVDSSEFIATLPSQAPLHLHYLHCVWGILQVGAYVFQVSLPHRFIHIPMGLKSWCCTPGEVFHLMKPKINRSTLSSHI